MRARGERRGGARRWAWAAAALLLAGCHKPRPDKVPGETDLVLREVSVRGEGGKALSVDPSPLLTRLGLRKGNVLYTNRYYNPFRQAEDRRRVRSFWQTAGYYEAEVDEPSVAIEPPGVTVRWTVREGPRYELASVAVRHAPEGFEGELRAMAPSAAGQRYDLEAMRIARYAMAERLQRAGYGHARVYSRAFVEREARRFHWQYLVDAGPKTTIRSLRVEGHKRVQEATIRRRAGLAEGEPFSLDRKERAEFDLLDAGSFTAVSVGSSADVEMYIGDVPDSGGLLDDNQIDAEGNLVPRPVPEGIDLVIRVVEAPATQLKLRAGVEADPTRLDASVGGELWKRDLLGGPHHLVLEGRLGYGHIWKDDVGTPGGLYGEALARTVHPGLLGRVVDGRLTLRYRDTLYPGFHLREVTAGPGLRTTAAPGLFLDLDALVRRGQSVGLGPFDDATRASLRLPADPVALGMQLDGSLVWDRRNDPAEPMAGHFASLRASFAPGGPLGSHRYLTVEPEARLYLPLGASASLGLRASGGWVALADGDGVPEGPRLFGGGAHGFRGTGLDRLSPRARSCDAAGQCRDPYVGGLSLAEGSVELRFLPPLKQYGLVVFVDAGGAGRRANPFESGVSAAAGAGPRLRLWYLPISIDVSYRFLSEGRTDAEARSIFVFLRIGEAF